MATRDQIAELRRAFEKVGENAKTLMQEAIDKGADELVDAIKTVTPTSELETHPGQLRDSVHKKDGADDLQKRVVVDAQDARGNFYAGHVEFGHRTMVVFGKLQPHDVGHVPADPFLYPTWRLMKKRIKSRIARAVVKAANMQASNVE